MKMKDLKIGMQVKHNDAWTVTVEAIVPKRAVLIYYRGSGGWDVVEAKDLTPLPVARTKELLQLADLLEKDAKTPTGLKFNMGFFGEVDKGGDKPEMNCGTTACAWGSAAISGIFKRQGVSYQLTPNYDDDNKMQIEVTYKNSTDFHAAEKFFNIGFYEAEYLFSPNYYPKSMTTGAKAERYVAKRIRNFVDYKLKGTKSRYYKETIKGLDGGKNEIT